MREEFELELENRIKNLIWTVSGDYTLDVKPDIESYHRSHAVGLYDGIKQGAFARYFNREELSLYLMKKIYLHGEEGPLMSLAQLCIEWSVAERITKEREGIKEIRKKALEDTLEMDFSRLAASEPGRLKLMLFKECLNGSEPATNRMRAFMEQVQALPDAKETIELIRTIDKLYNAMVDPNFEKRYGNLETVLAVSLEELAEFSWKDYLEEEALEESFGTYLEHLNEAMTNLDKMELDQETKKEEPEEETSQKKKILVVDEEALSKMHSYVQRNYGIGYLSETEEKRRNLLLCRGIHSDCSLYFTEGVLKHAVLRNYQYEYAKKQRDKNRYEYYNNHRMVKNNIRQLSDMLKKALVMRDEVQETISDRGRIVPSRLWRVGRSHDSRVFLRKLNHDNSDFVVDVLIDASGSQRKRQGQVAMQAYILSEALSIANVPHRVMSFCTFWDYTILHRFREYEDDRSANENIFEYNTSSNNRDGLAIKAAGYELLNREEEHKILIVLSDGRPYDVILNRPNARNPQPYQGKYAISDTAFEVRKLRSKGVCVLGVFAGEEKDLPAEKKIFGKDFAYIRDVAGFSGIVGRYLLKQLEREE
ncbi:nitric oxide reductase activation protein [Blautia stercoris]|uniref:cobaltochelatase CobT-related protein n=1 Tax=Blautia stercoris TaxID=871664 RepID=UPI00355AEDDA